MSRQAILVLGMHRSGTSALSGTLVRLGVTAPAHLIAGDEHNAAGYWESAPLNRLHEDLLQQLGTAWHGWTLLPEWSASPLASRFESELSRLLREEFQDSRLFVVKDPRMCRMVRVWIQHLQQEGVTASAVLVLRNPMEVAQSLARRNGFGIERSLLVWLRNVLEAEHQTRAIPRSLVLYDDLIDDCRSVARQVASDLGILWPLSPEALDPESCITGDLRHYALRFESPETTMLSRWVGDTWASLRCLMAPRHSGHDEARATLDIVRTQFDDASAAFGKAAMEERQALLGAEKQKLRDEAHAARAEQEQLIERLTAERDKATERVGQIQIALEVALQTQEELRTHANRTFNDLRASRAQLRETMGARDRLQEELAGLERRSTLMADELRTTQHRVESLLDSVSWRATRPARRVVDVFKRLAGYFAVEE